MRPHRTLDRVGCGTLMPVNIIFVEPHFPRNQREFPRALAAVGANVFGKSAILKLVVRLPDGAETYLDRPVRDYFSSLPEGTTTLFGRPVDYAAVRSAGRMAVHAGGGGAPLNGGGRCSGWR